MSTSDEYAGTAAEEEVLQRRFAELADELYWLVDNYGDRPFVNMNKGNIRAVALSLRLMGGEG